MKNVIGAFAILAVTAGSAFAGNAFGDGSRPNNYVAGQAAAAPVATEFHSKVGRHFGDGSVENKYVAGEKAMSGQAAYGAMHARNHFGDGSPENQQN
ncbi:hypothetical protein [Bartonella sp. LJL80]